MSFCLPIDDEGKNSSGDDGKDSELSDASQLVRWIKISTSNDGGQFAKDLESSSEIHWI